MSGCSSVSGSGLWGTFPVQRRQYLQEGRAGHSSSEEPTSEAFAGHLLTVLNHGSLGLMTSIGHCRTVSLAQGGEGLGVMWGEEKTREYLQRAGFHYLETNQLAHDFANNWYVARK